MRESVIGEMASSLPWRREQAAEWSLFKVLLWIAFGGLVVTLMVLSRPLEDSLRIARNNLHRHPVSGHIVLITIDNQSLREIGRWPWPRRYHAQLIDRLTAAGANRIFSDITFETQSDPSDDRLLAEAIERSGRVVLPVRGAYGPDGNSKQNPRPLEEFSRHAQLASIGVHYNYQNAVWDLPYSVDVGQTRLPSLAATLANNRTPGGAFGIDYSLDVNSVPTINSERIIGGHFDPRQIAGKDVIIGANAEVVGDQYYIPGVGRMGGVYVQILGAETLKSGTPLSLGKLWAALAALALAAFAVSRRKGVYQNLSFAAGVVAFLVVPIFLEAHLIFVDIAPALLVLTAVWAGMTWRSMRQRGLVNAISGLPNLDALRRNRDGRAQAIVAARVLNYEEIVAALPQKSEQQLVDQIVSRLTVGAADRILYQGDGGIFAWFEEPRAPFGNHLDALHSLFRNPARIGKLSADVSISFGVEVGSGRSLANRLASSLVAAEEAAHDGLKWKFHDPETLDNASWKLSMLSQLDEAIDRGEVWVAYQPKLDIASRRIIGAEALARWTHPEKGPIAASEFVGAAEQHNRIGKLTDFVLEKAIAAAVQLNRRSSGFEIAVNLSARLLTDKGFTLRLSALLARHGLPPQNLTLELTETAALTGSGEGLEMIARLRDLGVNIAIDDYGTGLSTLEYLKKIPATEIKIDQSFVKGMADNRSDRVMVQSTIGLAHSLGRKVVAEGVEHRDTLDLLTEMNCDVAQGYAIGRPMSIEALTKRISTDQRSAA